jgi:hypothetical protein
LERRAAVETPVAVVPCVDGAGDLGALLDRAGLARFHEHAATFEGDLACWPPEEVLYRAVLRALGYTANTRGFELLGAALPLATLRCLEADRNGGRPVAVQAALLGVAGLLPSQRAIPVAGGWPRLLEAAWADLSSVLGPSLPPGAWRTWRVRPENAPVRRAAGFSYLVSAWGAGDPLDRLLDDLAAAERAPGPASLAGRWQARAEPRDFWSVHYDFGVLSATPRPWLIGVGRAGEVAINVLLPFAYALGQSTGDAALSDRALALYRRYPSGPPNRVLREMARQVGGEDGARLARGACRQQGLIHLYRHWCDARDCAHCAANAT